MWLLHGASCLLRFGRSAGDVHVYSLLTGWRWGVTGRVLYAQTRPGQWVLLRGLAVNRKLGVLRRNFEIGSNNRSIFVWGQVIDRALSKDGRGQLKCARCERNFSIRLAGRGND